MLLKILGSFMILTSTSLVGYLYSRDCTRRPNELRDLQTMLQMFENEISYLSNLLSDAFEKIIQQNQNVVSIILQSTVVYLKDQEGLNAAMAWEKAVRENISKTALLKEDGEILISFGKMLGNSDLEGQIKNIHLTMIQLQAQEKKAEDRKNKYASMSQALGILAGVALVIILF